MQVIDASDSDDKIGGLALATCALSSSVLLRIPLVRTAAAVSSDGEPGIWLASASVATKTTRAGEHRLRPGHADMETLATRLLLKVAPNSVNARDA